jgi:N6-adenosine-specific RNA methylase IME4
METERKELLKMCEGKKYKTILADPAWDMGKFGKGKDMRKGRKYKVGEIIPTPYPTMTIQQICDLPIKDLSDENCHLWIWTTNKTLRDTFAVIDAWGFKYLNTITYNKPSGVGAWFVNTTQHLMFAYKGKLTMGDGRYARTTQNYIPTKHSKKPLSSYELIESISFPYYLELFARSKRKGWDAWGNEVDCDIEIDGFISKKGEEIFNNSFPQQSLFGDVS